MSFSTKKLIVVTKNIFDVHDLTEQVEFFLQETQAWNGLVNVYTTHTTTALKINEAEDGFHEDLKQVVFDELFRPDKGYRHNDLEIRDPKTLCPVNGHECLNGHSHVAQMFLGSASETIPVVDGKMQLGRWQRILFFELDHGKERIIILSFQGETHQ